MTWHTLQDCSSADANLAAGFLDGFGVELRVVDPVGVEIQRDMLLSVDSPVRVQVREADLHLAAGVLADAQSAPKRTATTKSLDRLGLSIRACAVSPFAPLGILLAPRYLIQAARVTAKPREHAWTLAGIAACVPASLFYAFAFHGMFLS